MKHLYRLALLQTVQFALTTHLTYSQSIPGVSPTNGTSFFVRVTPQTLSIQQTSNIIKQNLPLGINDQLVPLEKQPEQAGFTLDRFQQYYKGIKVEHGIYKVHNKNGTAHALSGEFYTIPDMLNVQPTLSQEQAIQKALAFVGAQKYKWQVASEEAWLKKQQSNPIATYFPEGELLICKVYRKNEVLVENGSLTLAYKFDVFAQEPLSRAYIYVDARTGEVIHQDAIIKHVDGTAQTRYRSQRTIATTLSNNTYQLRDVSRGLGVETYNMQSGTSYGSAIDFADNDNQWTTAEYSNLKKDNAALDCHWGAMKTYDYFKNVLGRNSFDGNGAKIKCYVHYGYNYVNAFWDGSVMTFGDGEMTGSTGIQPLTPLDITGHEIAHAVCQHTAGLVYSGESGAMNEGFSDIWGAMVEHYADSTKSTWTIGEDANFTIRSMSNPNAFQHPDTYKGQYWYSGSGDNGGVHYNSGVLNHWFYLLCIGKSGVNDNGDTYTVTGIGRQKAARIAYRTESVYLTANSQYKDARTFSIQAAKDLFGATSQEAIQTANAWYAVGVYDIAAAPSNLTATAISTTQINLSWTDNATNETGISIERSTTAASGFTQIATTGSNVVTYQDKNLATNTIYYYRVKAVLGTTSSTYSNTANAAVGTPPLVMSNGSATTCNAVLLDPGGAANYADYQYVTMTLSPETAGKKLRVAFSAFDTEASYDYLSIYDGSSTYAPLLGTYSGTALPPTMTATNASGQLTFYFYSNYATNRPGWQATVSCVTPPNTPANLVATTLSTTQINLSWTDSSTDETGFAIERSLSSSTGYAQIATVGANLTTYANAGLVTDTRYYYRVRALKADLYSPYSNIANAAIGNAPIIMGNGAITICDAVFLDPGGTGNYPDGYQSVTMTLSPATAGKMLQISFSSFNLASYYNYLSIYDGATTSAPLIGSYRDTTLPATITASNAAGQLTFYFYSYYSGAGWQANLSCVTPVAPVITALSPTRHSRQASLYSNITVSFSQAMQTATASASTIKIHGSQTGLRTTPAGGYFWGAGSTTATFDPSLNLKAGEVVSVTVTANARNLAGLALTPQVYQFTAEAAVAPANLVANAPIALPASPFGVAAADFDKDGDLDLATTHYLTAGVVSIKLNNGLGVFTGSGSVGAGSNPRALAAADLDNDGDVDLAITNQLTNTVSLRFNNGTGQFSGTTQLAVGVTPLAIVTGDWDGDGDVDIATANYGANTVSVRLNNGLGVFSGTTQVAVGLNPYWVVAADLDSDGDLDLATANYGANTVSVRLNNGLGVFSGTTQVAVGLKPVGLTLADWDGDGDVDLATANYGAGTVSVRFNDGKGLFTGSTEVSTAVGAWAVVAADLDGDGDQDLSVANATANTVSVRLNNGQGVFSGSSQVAVGSSPRALVAADLDNDQDLDLATANFTANSSSLLFNVFPPSISYFSPAKGPVGTSVVIRGGNFSNVTAVKFNNTVATSFTANSNYQITAVVPAGATKGNIKVITLGGMATSTGVFAVTATPSITNFSPGSGAAGTTLVITGTNFSDISSVAFNGKSASYVVNTPTQITAVVPSGTTTGLISINLTGGVAVNSAINFTVLPGVSMSSIWTTTCNDTFRDSGGSGMYGNDLYITQTFNPATPGSMLKFTFSSFDTEADYDILRIYDGSSTYAPLIGTYSGTTLPPAMTATNPSGQLTFFFTSDDTFTGEGWQASISCITPPNAPANLVATTLSTTQINLGWTDNATDETGFAIERSLSSATGFTQIATVGVNVTTYANPGLPTNARYYYRIRAIRGNVYSLYSNTANAAVGTLPLVMSNGSATTCNAVLLDPGGAANYADYQYVTMTLSPETAGKKLRVAFSAFDTEASYDYLSIYDGSSTYAPLLGTYSGTALPPTMTATNASGQLTFHFYSNYATTRPGWQATVSCVTPPNTPANLVATTLSTTQINLSWTDSSTDETGFAIERSLSSATGYAQIATVGANLTTYANAGLVTDTRYYYRIRALKADLYSPYSNIANAAVGNAPIIMGNGHLTICEAVFLDPGGTGNYPGYQNVTLTLTPATAGKMLRVAFSSFSLYSYYDYLSIYDGATTSAPLIGRYSGSTLPATITASNAAGQLTFYFYSYYSYVAAGWQANLSCVTPVAPVITALSPTRHSRQASLYSNITVSFSQAMQTATASASTIKIHGSQTGLRTTPAGGYFWGAGSTTATFDPSLNLKAGEVVSVTVTANARNLAGLALTPQVYQFTAEAAVAPANLVANAPIALPASPFGVAAADFDKDGDLDLATTHYLTAGVVSIKLNNGFGVFTGSGSVGAGSNPRALAAADLDNDGDVDLAITNQLTNTVSLRFNNGTGQFSGTTQLAVGVTPLAIVTGDWDGDGDVDIATANYGANTVSVRLNNGLGVFSGTTQVAVGLNPYWVVAADLDSDGDLDLATANYGANTVSVRFNNGLGVFSGTTQVAVGLKPVGLTLADWDGDGDVDLATANYGGGTVSVRFNDGKGLFTGSTEVSTAVGAWAVVAADLDGDGDQDLSVANATANTVSVRLNNGQGVFSGSSQVAVGSSPRALVAADLDNDQDLDLATANFTANSSSLLFNVLPLSQSMTGAISSNSTLEIESTVEKESKVYPNPFKDEIKLIIRSEQIQEVIITITDAYGKTVYTADGNTTNQEISLINHLSSGMYILRANYGDKVKIFQIVKIE